MDHRQHELHTWLNEACRLPAFTLQPMPGDASFRRYFRLHHPQGSYVVMDAPPERETCTAFIAIAEALRAKHLLTPEIFMADKGKGFLLLTDFGDQQLLTVLNQANAQGLYQSALQVLNHLRQCEHVPGWKVPLFTAHFMQQELELFKEWFLRNYLRLAWDSEIDRRLSEFFLFLAETAAAQPQVFMHRDYHSANLMVLDDQQIGILDFQDAFVGPVMYDVVSLLRDCYIDWPQPLVHRLVLYYRECLGWQNMSQDLFLRWFDFMGLQRHLKALLTFSRKYLRDDHPQYLSHVPRTLNYILAISAKHPECQHFYRFLCDEVMPAYLKVGPICAE